MNDVDIFKLIVQSNHPVAAAEFWGEHFILATGACSGLESPFQVGCLDDCRKMFRWLRDIHDPGWEDDSGTLASAVSSLKIAPRVNEPWEQSTLSIYRQIIGELIEGYQENARYREAALAALGDPNGDLFFARLEEWKESDRELNQEETGQSAG
jgi:hypothetical protein